MSDAVRLTTAQALVRWMTAQRSELLDGTEVPLFAGVFAIFGHGNVLGLGTALHEVARRAAHLARPERAGHGAGRDRLRPGHRPPPGDGGDRRPIGPGALNMVTAAGVAHANRLPVLLLPGDTFAGRAPDPVLQQVEHFGDPTTTVNDAFRPVSRYFDRITRPEQLLATLPQVARVLTDPADAGPVVLALPQDVQAEEFDFPAAMFEPRLHRVPRPRADRDGARRGGRGPARGRAAAARARRRRALLRRRRRGARLRRGARRTRRRDGRRPHAGAARPPAVRRRARHRRLHLGQRPRRRGRRGARGRHPAAGLHHLVVDRLLRRRADRDRQRRPLRRGQARRPGGGRRRARGAGRARRGAGRLVAPPTVGRRGAARGRAAWDADDRPAARRRRAPTGR